MRPTANPNEALPVTAAPAKRSAAQRRRDAARVQKRIEQRLAERSEAWASGDGRAALTILRQDGDRTPNGPDAYLHHEVPGSLKHMHADKRHAMHGTRLGTKENF